MSPTSLRQRLWERFILHRLGEWWAAIFLLIACIPLMGPGNITFSDLAFGKVSHNYLNYVLGVFNEQLGTPNWFNLPRLIWITPSYFLSWVLGRDGHIFLLSLIYAIFFVSVFSFGSLMRRLSEHRNIPISNFAICLGAIVYAMNPWVIIRIQHIFLLCGYALVPLALSWTWRVLGRESWENERPFTIRPSLSELRYHLTLGGIVSASFAGIHFGIFIILCMSGLGVLFATQAFPTAWRLKVRLRWFGWFLTRAILAGSTFLIFSIYWVGPFALSILGGVRPSQNNVNAIETVATFSRASALENIMLGVSYWWPMFEHRALSGIFWYSGWMVLIVCIFGVWYSKRWFIGLGIIMLFVLSSGTFSDELASTYISMVFDSPYPFGDMIRDPNKLYGVAALPIALCFGWGVDFLQRFKWRNIPLLRWEAFVCLILWLFPIYDVFMMGYYKPVVWPKEYEEMYTELESIGASREYNFKVLYLPVSDFALDKRRGYTTPDFNTFELHGKTAYKATGDHVAFDTRHDTLFPFEGNDINVLYFLLYFHHLMDHEDLEHVGGLLSKGGITHIVMRDDYEFWTERLDHYKDVLDAQTDLKKVWSNGMISIYEVLPVQPHAEPINHLIYSAGGLERMSWYPRMYNRSAKQFNILFPYSSHYQTLDILREGDAVETTDLPDLALIQLPKERFMFAADNIVSASPHLRWSKVVVSGHDWQYQAHFNQIRSDQFNFDMGAGVAFTSTPLSVPPAAYINPKHGPNLVEQPLLEHGSDFFAPIEEMDIEAQPTKDNRPMSINVIVPSSGIDAPPDDEEAHIWRAMESKPFPIEPENLYHLVGRFPRINNVDVELRVATYAADGNRLSTATAEIRTTIPEPPLAERDKSFLTPKDADHARLEIRVRTRRPEDIQFEVHDIRLHDLEIFASPNRLPLELKEKSGEQDGKLWVRSICSNQGGTIALRLKTDTQTWIEEIDTYCPTTAHFRWNPIDTPKGLHRQFELENINGTNAVNAFVWTSHEEYAQLIDQMERDLSDKILFHIVDSSMFTVDSAVMNTELSNQLLSGTMMHGLKGVLDTNFHIVHTANYAFSVQDYLPNPNDGYQLQIWRKKRNGQDVLILEDQVNHGDARRILESNDIGTTHVHSLSLQNGEYRVRLQLHSKTAPLLTERDFLDGDNTLHTTLISDELTRVIPLSEQNWASIFSPRIAVSHDHPLQLWFQIQVEQARSCHAKLRYYDVDGVELKTIYIDNIDNRNPEFQSIQHYDEPPKEAVTMQIQFLAQHILTPHPDASFTIKDLQLWTMSDAPAVDALSLVREPGLQLDDAPVEITDVLVKKGKRDLHIHPIDPNNRPTFTRFQLYESPIKHWDFYVNGEPIDGFAVNGIAFGVNVPVNEAQIYVEVPLNRVWKYGVLIGIGGLCLLGLLSIIKVIRRTVDFIQTRRNTP